VIINSNGDPVTQQFLANLKDSNGIHYPDTVTIDIALSGKNLKVKWESCIGTRQRNSGIAPVPETRDGQKSNLKAKRFNSWAGFKNAVPYRPTRSI
jgi:hypothetical protein